MGNYDDEYYEDKQREDDEYYERKNREDIEDREREEEDIHYGYYRDRSKGFFNKFFNR